MNSGIVVLHPAPEGRSIGMLRRYAGGVPRPFLGARRFSRARDDDGIDPRRVGGRPPRIPAAVQHASISPLSIAARAVTSNAAMSVETRTPASTVLWPHRAPPC